MAPSTFDMANATNSWFEETNWTSVAVEIANETVKNLTSRVMCRDVHDINISERCDFIRDTQDCQAGIGFVEYNEHMYCMFGPEQVTYMVILSVFWLLVLFAGLGVTANDFLCPSLFIISKSLKMSQNVAGVTLLAFGNGSPDIFSAIAGINQNKTEMVIGGLVGGGIFVTTVVAGSIFMTQSFSMMKRPFLRDVFFYLTAASWAFYLFFSEQLSLCHAIGFIGLYVSYIIVVVVSRFVHQKTLENNEKAKEAAASAEEKGLTIKSDKGDTYEDPEAYGITLTAFFKYRWDEDRRRSSRVHFCYDNDAFAISLPPLPEDDIPPPGYEETKIKRRSSSVSKPACAPGCSYGKVQKSEKLPLPEDVNEWADFLDKVCPVNLKEWANQQWWERAVDIIKSPILFILTITTPVVDYQTDRNNWSRILNCLHCVTGPLFIIFATGFGTEMIAGVVPVCVLILLLSAAVAVMIYLNTTANETPIYHTAYAYLGFGVAVIWIYCIANEIVVLLQAVGIVFNLSDSILGLTILAWGNCLLDFLSNLAVARKGFPRMGIAACFGAPFLTLLLGVGVPCLIKLAGPDGPTMPLIYSRLTTILFTTLGISLLSSVVTMTIFRFQVKRQYGMFLIGMYLCFLVIAVLAESSVF